MPDATNHLYLFEALELRAEYDARIKTLQGVLPEARAKNDRFDFRRDDDARRRPVASFEVDATREELAALELKRRKLNAAIQRANFDHTIPVGGDDLTLVEALELRKATNERLAELATQLGTAAYERVIYKEGRDIVEAPELDYARTRTALEGTRRLFRALNRALRAAAHQIVVAFTDEA